jgi:hypothetical protein
MNLEAIQGKPASLTGTLRRSSASDRLGTRGLRHEGDKVADEECGDDREHRPGCDEVTRLAEARQMQKSNGSNVP